MHPANDHSALAPRSPKIEARERMARAQIAATPPSYTLRAAEIALGMSTKTIRRRAKEGRLRLVKIEGRTLVDGDSLRALIRGDQVAA